MPEAISKLVAPQDQEEFKKNAEQFQYNLSATYTLHSKSRGFIGRTYQGPELLLEQGKFNDWVAFNTQLDDQKDISLVVEFTVIVKQKVKTATHVKALD